jgi:hypothetical protein
MVHYQGIEWSRIMRHIWKRGEQASREEGRAGQEKGGGGTASNFGSPKYSVSHFQQTTPCHCWHVLAALQLLS